MSAVTDVTYDKMRDAILRIFGYSVVIGGGSFAVAKPEAKVEPVLCSENKPIGNENVFIQEEELIFIHGRVIDVVVVELEYLTVGQMHHTSLICMVES